MDSVSHAHAGVKGEQRKTHAAGCRVGRGAERGARKDVDTYTYPVVVSAVDVSGHAKVSDLHQQVLTNQTVSFSKREKEIKNYN